MSERSYSGAPRTNPLYGGGGSNPGSRTPSWAVKGNGAPRSSAYSEAASSPPDSPGRGAHYYEPQYDENVYTVQTPGPGYQQNTDGGESPYRQPPYFVQTPAQSEMHRGGDHSPFSSAPPSPQHSIGAGTAAFDARSTRSGRSRASMRVPGSAPPPIKTIDEEDGEGEGEGDTLKKADPAAAAAKKKTMWRIVGGVCCVLLMAAIVGTAVGLWFIFQPHPPTYTFEGMTVNNFTTVPGYDFNGLPTRLMFMDIMAHWSVKNTNKHFSVYFNGGLAQCGYGSLPVISQTGFTRRFWLSSGHKGNVSSHFQASGFPLYNVGPLYYKDLEDGVAQLDVNAQLVTYVPVLWKLVQPRFTTGALCNINFNPQYNLFINATCTWS